MRIAIVIPACNAGRFLNEAIDSVRAQTIMQWDCMIVDDGSTDDIPSRLAAYRDSRIRRIRQHDVGKRVARARVTSVIRNPTCGAVRRSEPFGDWLLLAGAAINHKCAYTG